MLTCVCVCVLLKQDVLTAAAAAVTSSHLVTSRDVTTCPIITLSTDSELADIGESCITAELPQKSDWLSTIQSSSVLSNQSTDLLTLTNHSADVLTVQSLDVNDNYVTVDVSLPRQTRGGDLDELDGTVTPDDDLSDNLLQRGNSVFCHIPWCSVDVIW